MENILLKPVTINRHQVHLTMMTLRKLRYCTKSQCQPAMASEI